MKRLTILFLVILFTLPIFADIVYDDQNNLVYTVSTVGDLAGYSPKPADIGVVTAGNRYVWDGSSWVDLTSASGTINIGDELLSDTGDFSGNWTLANDFDLATTDFEYNHSADNGTMTQANADFSGTLVASTWYLLRITLSDATTPVAATSIEASLGTSTINIELGAVQTYYYMIQSDAVITGDDFVITVTTSTAGDITGTLVSLCEIISSYGAFDNLFITNDLKVENDLYVGGLTTNRIPYVGADGKIIDDADLTFDGSTLTAPNTVLNGYLLFNDPGTDANSFITQWQADNSTTVQTASLQTLYGANPSFMLKAPNNSGTETEVAEFFDESVIWFAGAVGVDYTFVFDGDTQDGTITYDESEDEFVFNNGIASAYLNTGQGDYELFAMNQDVEDTDDVTFNSGTFSGLTSGRVIYGGTAGLLQDSANFLFDGTNASFVNPVYFGAGTLTLPSITFTGDLDTGFYQAAANRINITCGNDEVAFFTDTGLTGGDSKGPTVYFDFAASTTQPVYVCRADTDTGIGFDSDTGDVLSLITGGVQAVSISEATTITGILVDNWSVTGTLGVTGTITGSAALTGFTNLDLSGHLYLVLENDAVTPTLNFGDDGDGIYSSADGKLDFATNAVNRMQLGDAGLLLTNQGNDTNSPSLSMTANDGGVAQTATFQVLYGASPYFRFSVPDGGGSTIPIVDYHTTSITYFNAIAGVDYYQTWNGESNDGTITYMEDEDRFDFDNDVHIVNDLYVNDVFITPGDNLDLGSYEIDYNTGGAGGYHTLSTDCPNLAAFIFWQGSGTDNELNASTGTQYFMNNRIRVDQSGDAKFVGLGLTMLEEDVGTGGGSYIACEAVGGATEFAIDLDGNIRTVSALFLDEKASQETIVAGEGQFWVKNTSPTIAMFTDDDGDDHVIELGSSAYAEMGTYAGDSTELLRSADEWHGVFNIAGIASSEIEGFTYLDGEEFGITDVVDNGATVTFTTSAQTLVAGQFVTIQETTSHDGVWEITSVADVTHFTITTAIDDDEAAITAYGQRGASLTVGSESTSLYRGVWASVVKQSGVNKVIQFSPFLNTTEASKAWCKRKFSSATDSGSVSGVALMNLTAGDVIWFGVQGDTAALTVTFERRNMTIH
jgi:hypothetical protein